MEIRTEQSSFSQRLVISFLLGLILFLIPCNLSGQEKDQFLDAQWKDSILENQRFSLKIITPYPGKQSVTIKDPQWPEGIQKVSGPYTAQLTKQKDDGSFGTVLQVIYTLRSGGAGIYTIPPVTVIPRLSREIPGPLADPLSSRELFIPILQSDEKHLNYPLILGWEDVPASLYVGQSTALVLLMNNMEEIDLPETVSFPSPGGAILENTEGLGEIGFRGLDHLTLFNVPMDTWMLTPSREGTLTLQAANVSIAGVRRSTSRQSIKILPLPEAIRDSGALGDFNISLDLSARNIVPGSSLSLYIRIEGKGNLNYLNMPEPVFPEGLNPSVRETQELTAVPDGFEGFREKVYTLRPEVLNNYEITIPAYSWLNPQNGRVETRSESHLKFSVAGNLAVEGESSSFSFSLMPLNDSRNARGWTLYRNPFFYLLLLPGLIFLTFILTIKRIRPALLSVFFFSILFLSASDSIPEIPEWIGEAQIQFDKGAYPEALELYRENASGWNNNGTYLFNRAVLSFLSGEQSHGVLYLRRAMALMPMNHQIHESLGIMEDLMGLENQHRARFFVHPDILLLTFLLSLNATLISLAYCFLKKSSWPVILFSILLPLSLLSGGELFRTAWTLNRPLAVLEKRSVVKKIPEAIGSDWLSLPSAASVEYKKEVGEYILINTSYGLEGWVLKDNLLLLKERSHP